MIFNRLLILFITLIFSKNNFLLAQKQSPIEYIQKYKEIAMEQMKKNKIPASIILAQGCLESSYGNSRLAVQGNNHFGIKCKKNWTGGTIIEDDDTIGECFRAYRNAEESFKDHGLFLTENQRYAFLFDYQTGDYKAWAEGLRKAGYATNPKYPQLLIGMIERYNLAKYDSLVLGLNTGLSHYNGILATKMTTNTTLEDIALQNARTAQRLRKVNDLEPGQIIAPGDIVYLNRKKRKAEDTYHTVVSGENLWSISQANGIKLKRLKKLNHILADEEALAGQVINMRYKADEKPKTDKSQLLENIMAKENAFRYDGKTKIHEVAEGESLYSIAKKYNTSIDTLKQINLLQSNNLQLGQLLKVPENILEIGIQNAEYHIVKSGETLYAISKKYNISVDEIKSMNMLSDNTLVIGMKLKIKP